MPGSRTDSGSSTPPYRRTDPGPSAPSLHGTDPGPSTSFRRPRRGAPAPLARPRLAPSAYLAADAKLGPSALPLPPAAPGGGALRAARRRWRSAARPAVAAPPAGGEIAAGPVLLLLLALLLAWKGYGLLAGDYRVLDTWSALDYVGASAQDLFAWSLVAVGWLALRRGRAAGIAWLAVGANVLLLTQLVDARLKVRFLQPLTLDWLRFLRSEARTLSQDASVFTGNAFWKGAVVSLLMLNATLAAAAVPGAARAWRRAAVGAWRRVAPRRALPGRARLRSVAVAAALGLAGVALVAPARPYGLHRNFLAGLVLPRANAVAGATGHADRPSDQRVRSDLDVGGAAARLGLARPPRNVVLYVVESMALEATSLGASGADTTPFLAELARTSLVTPAYAQLPNSTKAMFSLLTGLYASQVMEVLECQIPGVTGLARSLRERGYATATVTPQHLYFQGARTAFRNYGFEEIAGFLELEQVAAAAGAPLGKQAVHDDRVVLLWDLDRLAGERPFLVTYYTNSSHYPYAFPGHDPEVADEDRYRAALRYTDDVLREVYAEFERRGLLEDTLFVITSDHGEDFTDGRFTGRGASMRESTHRVPLLFHVPGADLSGTELPVARHVDVFPTVMDLLGHGLEGVPVQGRSLLDGHGAQPAYLNSFGTCRFAARVDGARKHVYALDADELWVADLVADATGRTLVPVPREQDRDVRRELRDFTVYNEALLRDLADRR